MLLVSNKATPSTICGPDGSASNEYLRASPPREHGGNMDIRYSQSGSSVYVGVTAVLPFDIFIGELVESESP